MARALCPHTMRAPSWRRAILSRARLISRSKNAAWIACIWIFTIGPLNSCAPIFQRFWRAASNSASISRASRFASNSLLECVVMGRAAAQAILAASEKERHEIPALPAWDESRVTDSDEEVVITHNWDELRRLMWNYVGIVRTDKRLARAAHRIVRLREEIDEYYAHFRISRDLLELRNLVDVASLIVESARFRHESRGLHFNRDWPEMQPKGLPTILSRAFSSRVTTGASAKRHRENH